MNTHCPDEHNLIAAIRAGKLTNEMEKHLKTCAHCREIAEMTKQLEAFSESLPAPRIPNASRLYQLGKQAKADPSYRVLLPIRIAQLVLATTIIVALIVGLFTGSHLFLRAIQWLYSLPGLAGLTGAAALIVRAGTLAGLLIAAILPLATLAMWFHDIVHELRVA